jgi:hypothetical protein
MQTRTGASEAAQSRLNRYCAARGKETLNGGEQFSRVEAFYSWKINSCVQIEVANGDKDWSYDLQDVTNGFFRGPKLVKSESPLSVLHDESIGWVSAKGFWQSTDPSSDKQLAEQIAAKIECSRDEKVCRESDATVFMGLVDPDSNEYAISSWTSSGIVADDTNEGPCAIGHRLSIDFKSNSVVVTDYPKKLGGSNDCAPFQTANSYSLHGGALGFQSSNEIFSCTRAGANSAILAKVNEYHGDVSDKAYSLWMDDGARGAPATMKAPKSPYTRRDCERLMENKLTELRAP